MKNVDLESRDFYEIMQAYRHDKGTGAETFEAVKVWLRNPTYEYEEYEHNHILTCPKCGSSRVTMTQENVYSANEREFCWKGTDVDDPDSKSQCLECKWVGVKENLIIIIGKNNESN